MNWKIMIGFIEIFLVFIATGLTYKLTNYSVGYGILALIISAVFVSILDRILRKTTRFVP